MDSDLDWGQDTKRLAQRLREVGAQELTFTQFFAADLGAQGFPAVRPSDPFKPTPGWNAVSLTVLKQTRFGLWGDHLEVSFWMDQILPTERIGKGMWLWYMPPLAESGVK